MPRRFLTSVALAVLWLSAAVPLTARAGDDPGDTTSVVLDGPPSSSCGSTIALAITVQPDDAEGTLELFDGTTSLGTTKVDKKKGPIAWPIVDLGAGLHRFRAVFADEKKKHDATSNEFPHRVLAVPSTLQMTATSASVRPGDPVTLIAHLISNAENRTGQIEFIEADRVLSVVALDQDVATLDVTLSEGTHYLDAYFRGDDCRLRSDARVIVTVESEPRLLMAPVSAMEGDEGVTPMVFTVTLSRKTDQPVTVDYRTVDANANVQDRDFVAVQGTLTFEPGETERTIEVPILGDHVYEPSSEFFGMQLSNPVHARLPVALVRGTIQDDDPFPGASIGDVSVVEGDEGTHDLVIPLWLSNPHGSLALEVMFQTAARSAKEFVDYERVRGSATFPIKSTQAVVVVPIHGDLECEGDETFTVKLSTPGTSGTPGTPSRPTTYPRIVAGLATVTIHDDDCGTTPTLMAQLTANAVPDGIELRWRFNEEDAPRGAILERSGLEQGPWTAAIAALRDEGGATVALDRSAAPGASYWYRLRATAAGGGESIFGPIFATAAARNTVSGLGRIGPNPGAGPADVEFLLTRDSDVHLSVVDVQGREVAVIAEGEHRAGRYHARWDARTENGMAPSGLYFVRLVIPGGSWTKGFVLAR